MADLRKHSSTSNVFRVVLKNASTGVGLTGLTEASAGLIIATIADNEATTTRYRASSSEVETIATLGTFAAPSSTKCRFKEVDATNHPGLYEVQLADARVSVASAKRLVVSWAGAASLLAGDYEIQLTQTDVYDAVRAGMTALPNAAAEASGGLPTLSAAQASNGTIQANVHRWLTGTPNALQSGRVDSYVGAIVNGAITAATFAANALDAVWSTAARVLTAGTNIVLAKGVGVTGFNDITAADVWASGTRTLSSFGTLVADVATAVWAAASRTLTAFAFTPSLDAAYDAAKTAASQTSVDDLPTNAELATALAAADDAVLAAVATRASQTSVDDVPTNAELATALAAADDAVLAAVAAAKAVIDLIDTKTTNLPIDPADQSLIIAATTALAAAIAALPTTADHADKFLGRNLAGGSDGGRTVQDALRFSRNRVTISGSTLTVYAEDDVTPAWTGIVTRVAADALSEVNPA